MPLFKTITVNNNTKVLIWKIEEPLNFLLKEIDLTLKSRNRLESMKSEIHQRGFLSVRLLLKEVGYSDSDLVYDEFGKPHLKDGKHISITHSYHFSGIIISDKNPVGIDIEKQRDKIIRIAHKFTPITSDAYSKIKNTIELIKKITIVWGAKESLYKIYGKKKLRFLEHIFITDFTSDAKKTNGEISYNDKIAIFDVHFLEFEGFTCVFAY